MKFDSNLAWKQASSAISANREMLLALAGVFFLLPGLALALLFPAPEPVAGSEAKETLELIQGYYISILPFVIPMVLFQAAGTLALLTLLTDRTRPTVGEAIRLALKGIVPYFLAQIVLGLAIGLVGGLLLAPGAATASGGLSAIGIALTVLVAAYAGVKTSLAGPVIVVEGQRNPIEALKRSWLLTKGNSIRIALFYLLVAVAFLVVIMIVTAIIGILLVLLAGPHIGEMVNAVVSAALNAIMALYFVAIIAAAHRQLAGPSPDADGRTFE